MSPADESDIAGFLCHICIGDKYLKSQIKRTCGVHVCSACSKRRKAIALEDLGRVLDEVLRRDLIQVAPYGDWGGGDDLNFWVQEILGVEPEVAELAIAAAKDQEDSYSIYKDGGTSFYESGAEYTETEAYPGEYASMWNAFCHNVKHTSRFFSDIAEGRLREIFDDLGRYQTRDGKKPIRRLEPTDPVLPIYRARVATSEAAALQMVIYPSGNLGPPPASAAIPLRMNPAGISVFYGGLDIETCISEIRPPVGSLVVGAAFELLKTLHVLDLTVLDHAHAELSYFQPDFQQITEHLEFLRSFHAQISRPVLPSDEALAYIPTQVVAEFLAHRHEPQLDGVLYASTQRGGQGLNIVLFHHASQVEPSPAFPAKEGLTGSIMEDHDLEEAFIISTVGESGHKQSSEPSVFIDRVGDGDRSDIVREPTLRVVADSLWMKRVMSTTYAHGKVSIFDFSTRSKNSLESDQIF